MKWDARVEPGHDNKKSNEGLSMIDDPKRRGLGRGLAALMGEPAPGSEAAAARGPAGGVREIPIEQLKPNPYQPRKVFNKEALEELAQSIKSKGVLQPLLVRRAKDGQGYEIIAGERRWRAAQLAGLAAKLGPRGDVTALIESEAAARRIFWKEKRDIGEQLRRWRGRRLERLVDKLVQLHRALLTNSQQAELLLAQGLADITRVAAARSQG